MNKEKVASDCLPCPWCGMLPMIQPWHGGPKTKRMISCVNEYCHVTPMVSGPTGVVAKHRWNTRQVQS